VPERSNRFSRRTVRCSKASSNSTTRRYHAVICPYPLSHRSIAELQNAGAAEIDWLPPPGVTTRRGRRLHCLPRVWLGEAHRWLDHLIPLGIWQVAGD
jgi:hypothetical protein